MAAMATDFDPYRILGLDPSAPPALVEAAYQQMVLRYKDEPERLQEVEAAYRLLIDPEQRQAYAVRRAATLATLPPDADIDAALARVGQTSFPTTSPALTLSVGPAAETLVLTGVSVTERVTQLLADGRHQLLDSGSVDATLLRKKNFSWNWWLLWFILGIYPMLVYLAYHFWNRDSLVTLAQAQEGVLETVSPILREPAIDSNTPVWNLWDMAKAIGIVIGGTLVASVPVVVFAESLLESGEEVEDNALALTITLAVSLVLELLLLITTMWFGPRKYKLPLSALGLRWPPREGLWFRIWFPVALAFSALGIVITYFAVLKLFGLEPSSDVPEEVFDNPGPLIVMTVLAVAFAPIMEEIFFRGFIFGGLRGRWGWVAAGLASGGLFGMAHFSNPGTLYVVPPIAGIGFLFAWAYRYTGSITSSIIAHFIYNSISVAAGIATSVIWLHA